MEKNANEKVLGIIGGMGPLATAYFYELIINRTKASKDQDHINMIILNDASMPDRTAYIIGESDESPLPKLIKDAKMLESCGVSLIAVPCNTSTYFYNEVSSSVNVPILNMIEDTIECVKSDGAKKVLLLATEGTLSSGLYQKACEKYGVEYMTPKNPKDIMRIIYDRVKKNIPLTDKDISALYEGYNEVDRVILGCTELSVLKTSLGLGSRFVDPLEVEADKIIDFFGKELNEDYAPMSLEGLRRARAKLEKVRNSSNTDISNTMTL